ncbi:uncharacterized protein LOC135482181 [Liolophura sinensis]|uniref:uncharacterized protein LOC135482181 n=1 Tax=Liolophura sinensis TaxID=3198878 RepID=UPI0031592AE7
MTLLAMMECLQGHVTEPSQTAYQNIQHRFANISPECPKELIHLVEICIRRASHDKFTFSDLYLVFQSLYPLKLFSVWDVSLHNVIVPKHQKWVVFRRQLFEVTPKTAAVEPSSDTDTEASENLIGDRNHQGVMGEGSTHVSYVCDCDMNSADQPCGGDLTLCDEHCQGHSTSISCNENICPEDVCDQDNHSTIAQNRDCGEFSEGHDSVSLVFKGEHNKMCKIGFRCDDCVIHENDICLCENIATSGACSSVDSGEDAISESWQEVTESQCDSSDEDNVRMFGVGLCPCEDNRCSAQDGTTFCELSGLEPITNNSDNDNGICFSDEEDLILQPNDVDYRSGNESTEKQKSIDHSSKGSGNSLYYDNIGFFSDNDTDLQTEGIENVPTEQTDFFMDNARVQNDGKITKTYLPNEEIHFIDDDSENNDIVDTKGLCTNPTENGSQSEGYADNFVTRDELSSFSEYDCEGSRSDGHLNPHEQIGFLSDDDHCYQNGATCRTFNDERLNVIGSDCSCVHRTGGMNCMTDEDPRYRCDNELSFHNGSSISDDDCITTDDISVFNDQGFCDEDNNVASSQEAENGNDDIQRDEIGFLSDNDLYIPKEECSFRGTISPHEEMSAYQDNRSNSDKHNHFLEICSPGDEENGNEDDRRGDLSNFRSMCLVNTCQCLLLDNVLDVPHMAVETVSFTDFSASLESNVVNIKGVKLTVGRRIGYMCELSVAQYWSDIRQDLTMLLQDFEAKQHGVSKASIKKDFKGCLLRKLRDIDSEHFEHQEFPVQRDGNARAFPVPSEIQSDSSRLRSWLNNWVPFDTDLPESGCAWKELEYSGEFSETNQVTESPWYGEWKPFDMSIEGETAWPNLPEDVIANDVPTKQQLIVIESRQKHKHWQTEDHMAKRRLNLGRYFKEKYGFQSNIIDGYLGFVTRLKESDEMLKSLVDMDLSFIMV